MQKVVLLTLERIILHLWNRDIQTNKINFVLYKFNEYLHMMTLNIICWMFLITFWEVPILKTWHCLQDRKRFDLQSKNTKILIFIKMDLGLFKLGVTWT